VMSNDSIFMGYASQQNHVPFSPFLAYDVNQKYNSLSCAC